MLDSFLSALGQLLKLHPTTPAPVVPATELVAFGANRPGLSVERSMANYLADKRRLGLPVGNYPDGSPNYDEMLARALFRELYRALHEDLRVTAAVPPGISLTAAGASAAGPVTVTGFTMEPVNAFGIVQ
jgi:hypothetical protein